MNFKEKIVRLCILFIFVLTSQISASAKESSTFNWQPVIDAIIEVESNGDTRAKSGNSVGAMQITPIWLQNVITFFAAAIKKSVISFLIDLACKSQRKCSC